LDGQAAWQQAVLQIAADPMRMRWDERIPEDFARALCAIVYDARRT
jgi:hypothetical protein